MSRARVWIEAMRLRTLPVSVAGVITAAAYAAAYGCLEWLPALLCLAFAVLAQISSNFANEYYDYRDGLDRAGRDGPRRGVTEGDISPRAMLCATFATLALACCIGLSLVRWGGWWLIPAGVLIALGVLAYSSGPYPLSRHCLGEVAVVFFFGIIPVNLTFYVVTGHFAVSVAEASVALGLMGANVLLVNNYRDREDDALVGKNTLAVVYGSRFASTLYLFNGYIAAAFLAPEALLANGLLWIPVSVYIIAHTALWRQLTLRRGPSLNPMLGMTACLMLLVSLLLFIILKLT